MGIGQERGLEGLLDRGLRALAIREVLRKGCGYQEASEGVLPYNVVAKGRDMLYSDTTHQLLQTKWH